MGINLGGGINTNNNGQAQGISLNLVKGDILDLTKKNPGLKKVTLGTGWDISPSGAGADLDLFAFLLDENNKFNTTSNIIFFNNKVVPGIVMGSDNRTGAGDGDDEVMSIDLTQVDASIKKIVVGIFIFDALAKRQTFGMINNSYVRLLDSEAGNKELCRFNLKTDGSTGTSVVFAELSRDGSDWKFETIGEPKIADLNGLAAMYS